MGAPRFKVKQAHKLETYRKMLKRGNVTVTLLFMNDKLVDVFATMELAVQYTVDNPGNYEFMERLVRVG